MFCYLHEIMQKFASNNICEDLDEFVMQKVLLDEEDVLVCECEIPADLCPGKKNSIFF